MIFKNNKNEDDASSQDELKKTVMYLTSNNNVLVGKNIAFSGKLQLKEDDNLIGKSIAVFIDETYFKTIETDKFGEFKDIFPSQNSGNIKIKAVYSGDWEYEGCCAITSVEVIEAKNDYGPDTDLNIANQLEKVANLYQQGLLSDEEFKTAKNKILK